MSRGTCQNFVSFAIVAAGVTFLKVILNGTKNVLISNFLSVRKIKRKREREREKEKERKRKIARDRE